MIFSFFPNYFHLGKTRFLFIFINFDANFVFKREESETRFQEESVEKGVV
jgi:hypothetical protein